MRTIPLTPSHTLLSLLSTQSAFDYALVLLAPSVSLEPWPDILDDVRMALESAPGVTVAWSPGPGLDKLWRVFYESTQTPLVDLQGVVDAFLWTNNIAFQGSHQNRNFRRVVFDIITQQWADRSVMGLDGALRLG
jgi:hypothetical protein